MKNFCRSLSRTGIQSIYELSIVEERKIIYTNISPKFSSLSSFIAIEHGKNRAKKSMFPTILIVRKEQYLSSRRELFNFVQLFWPESDQGFPSSFLDWMNVPRDKRYSPWSCQSGKLIRRNRESPNLNNGLDTNQNKEVLLKILQLCRVNQDPDGILYKWLAGRYRNERVQGVRGSLVVFCRCLQAQNRLLF